MTFFTLQQGRSVIQGLGMVREAMKIFKSLLMSKVFISIVLGLLWGSFGYALEISDLSLPMNRDKADATLSKDYMYKVLGDATIRRTWQLKDKKVFMDFAADSGDLLLIAIEYNKPVARKVGLKDAKTIAGEKLDKDAKWAPPKNEEARKLVQETFGLENPMRMKLKDGAVLFYETGKSKGKIARVSLFASMPATNRWVLSTLSPESPRTALGLQMTSDEIAALYKDEQRRMAIPLAAKTSDQTSVAGMTSGGKGDDVGTGSSPGTASSPSRGSRINRGVTALGSVTGASRHSSPPSRVVAGRTEKVVVTEHKEGFSVEEYLGDPPDWLQVVGIEEPEWWHYFAGGIGVFLLLSFIISGVSSSVSRARQRAAFAKVMASRATPGKKRPRVNR